MSKQGRKKQGSSTKTASSVSAAEEPRSPESSTLSGGTFDVAALRDGRGTESAGQSGDLQGLSSAEFASSESVEELVAEGQYREAEILDAVESAKDPDQGELRTREVLEDDVPTEYIGND